MIYKINYTNNSIRITRIPDEYQTKFLRELEYQTICEYSNGYLIRSLIAQPNENLKHDLLKNEVKASLKSEASACRASKLSSMIKTKRHSDCSVVQRSGRSRTGCGYSSEGAIATRYAGVGQRGREFANGVRSEGAAGSRLQGNACSTLIIFV